MHHAAANIAGKNDETGLPNGRYVWSDEQNFQVLVISWPCSAKPLVIFHHFH